MNRRDEGCNVAQSNGCKDWDIAGMQARLVKPNIDLYKPGEPGEITCEGNLERRTTKKSKLLAVL
jgi:hypothetical protein